MDSSPSLREGARRVLCDTTWVTRISRDPEYLGTVVSYRKYRDCFVLIVCT
jgi:hypothetical protein